MRAGQLRHMITFQSQTQVADGLGGYTTTWTDVDGMTNVWASIEPMKVEERTEFNKLTPIILNKIQVWYNSAVTVTHAMRIEFGSRYFKIMGIRNPGEIDLYLEITGEEYDGD